MTTTVHKAPIELNFLFLIFHIIIIKFILFIRFQVYFAIAACVVVALPASLDARPYSGQMQDQAERTREKRSTDSTYNKSSSHNSSALCKWTWQIIKDDLYEPIKKAVCNTSCTNCTNTFGDNYSCHPEMRTLTVLRRNESVSDNNMTYSKWYPSTEVIPVACVCAPNATFLYTPTYRGQTQDQEERTHEKRSTNSTFHNSSEIPLHSSHSSSALCKWTWQTIKDDLYEPIKKAVCNASCTNCTNTFGDNYSCQPEMRALTVLRRNESVSDNNMTYSKWYPLTEVIPVACVCAPNAPFLYTPTYRGQTQDQEERTREKRSPDSTFHKSSESPRALHSSHSSSALCKWTWQTIKDDLYEPIKKAVCDTSCTNCTNAFGDNYSCQPEMRALTVLRRNESISDNNMTYSEWYPSTEVISVACVCAPNAPFLYTPTYRGQTQDQEERTREKRSTNSTFHKSSEIPLHSIHSSSALCKWTWQTIKDDLYEPIKKSCL